MSEKLYIVHAHYITIQVNDYMLNSICFGISECEYKKSTNPTAATAQTSLLFLGLANTLSENEHTNRKLYYILYYILYY